MQYVFIHGLGQCPSSWDRTSEYLPKEIQADYPDLFSLLENKEITYGNLYDAFQEYCEKIDAPLTCCGFSLGAVLALNYTVNHSEKVKSLILIAPQYKAPRALLKFQSIIFRFIPATSFSGIGVSKNNIIHLTNSMQYLDFTNSVSNILCPTLIICGKRDKMNKKAAKMLTNMIPRALFYEVENAGHEVNTDVPKTLAQVIMDFQKIKV